MWGWHFRLETIFWCFSLKVGKDIVNLGSREERNGDGLSLRFLSLMCKSIENDSGVARVI